jgi:hypothetical protein
MTDHYSREYVKSLLERWGEWCESHLDDQHGLPTINAIEHLGTGSGSIPGHRILCREMPRRVWITNYHVTHQEPIYREALTAWYVFHVKPGGGRWTAREKAHLLDLSYDNLRIRVSRARALLCISGLQYC